ncbi:MAG: hypothetical protein Q9187_005749 [Circinaria calcarea]
MPETSNTSGPLPGSWRGVLGSEEFPAEKDRYHLYVGLFCPFAHRVILIRQLKGLQELLPMSVVKAYPKGDEGWRFPNSDSEYPGSTVDHLFNSSFLHEIYYRSPPTFKEYKGKFSVPVLWDKKTNQIVNNESEDIMRQLNTAFNHLLPEGPQRALNFYPSDLSTEIDEVNSWLVPDLNLGVYKAGFAADQEGYSKACATVFATLDKLQEILIAHNRPYILKDQISELDLKAYATLIRFDTIYVQHFKLNVGMIRHNYPYLHRYIKNMYFNVEGVRDTTDFKHIKENYVKSHPGINPQGIVPDGPVPNLEAWSEMCEKWRATWANPDGTLNGQIYLSYPEWLLGLRTGRLSISN